MADLQILDISKSFGSLEVLKGVNLEVQAGEFVVFVGPSGCGKSTLLRMISGLEGISSGTMRLGGKVINDVDPAKRGIAMVFQSYALYPHMTVFQNMAFSLTMAWAPRKEIRERVEKAADILQLRDLLDRKPGQLSGGQKQRVAIGRTIVREPELFLFDEPLSNLDAELRVQMRAEIIELHRKLGSTMIFVTHDQIEAMTLADKMVVMNEGVIQQWGAPLEIYDDPDNKFVASFIGTPRMNFMRAHVVEVHDDHIVVVRAGDHADPEPVAVPFKGFDPGLKEVELGIRPEHVRVVEKVDSSSCVPIDVRLVEELGDITYVHATLPGGSRLTAQSYGQRHTGAHQVHAVLDTDQMLVFDLEGNRLRNADRLRN